MIGISQTIFLLYTTMPQISTQARNLVAATAQEAGGGPG
jgi:hypothetical protein